MEKKVDTKKKRGYKLKNVPYSHSYAAYLLLKQGKYQIFRGDEKIINWRFNSPMMSTTWLDNPIFTAKFKCGSIEKTEHTKKIDDYTILKHLGFCITAERRQEFYTLGARKIKKVKYYSLKSYERFKDKMVINFPKNYYVDYDPTFKTIILRGEKADGKLIHLGREMKHNPKAYNKWYSGLSWSQQIAHTSGVRKIAPILEKEKIIDVKEPILGISKEEHKLVCLPKFENPPRMGFVGKTGSYKSIWANSVLGQIYHTWQVPFIHLNDWKFETHAWSRPIEHSNSKFLDILERFGLVTSPSPIIYFTPQKLIKDDSKRNFKEEEKKLMLNRENVHYFLPLDIKFIMQNWNLLFGGFEEMKLGKSRKLFNLNELAEATTKKMLDNLIENSPAPSQSKGRISSALDKMFEYGLTNLDSGINPNFTVKRIVGDKIIDEHIMHPIMACVFCRLNVVVITSELQGIEFGNTSFVSSYIKGIVNTIINSKRKNNLFNDFTFFVFIDELEQITAKGAIQPILELSSVTRSENIGFIWATQTYTKVDPTIRTNTQYLFCMKSGGDIEQANAMVRNYSAGPLIKRELPKIGIKEEGECYLLHDEPVIFYDLDTGEKSIDKDTPIKLSLLPPINNHFKPKGVK